MLYDFIMSQVLMDKKACPLKGQCHERTNMCDRVIVYYCTKSFTASGYRCGWHIISCLTISMWLCGYTFSKSIFVCEQCHNSNARICVIISNIEPEWAYTFSQCMHFEPMHYRNASLYCLQTRQPGKPGLCVS